MTLLRLHRAACGVTTLGFGSRAVIWTQGCTIACRGCATPDSWDETGGVLTSPAAVVAWIQQQKVRPAGLSVSGGEPSLQHDAVIEVATAYRDAFPGTDVLLFSGLTFAELERRYPALVAAVDIICAGPFVHTLPALPLRGSSNQTVHALSDLARQRYADLDHWPMAEQMLVEHDRIITVGIPNGNRPLADRAAAFLRQE
jgi:anaerobic ribonucleoside-triphosphate reductase activating protein